MVRSAAALTLVVVLGALGCGGGSPEADDGRCAGGYVALTIDDGPSPTSPALVAALQRHGLKATMFVTGQNAQLRPDAVRAQARAGLWVENHTVSHAHLTRLTDAQLAAEIADAQSIVQRLTGRAPTLFRPPFLETDERVRAAVRRHGLVEVLATVDSRDYAGATAAQIVAAADRLAPGGILLLHDWPPATIQAIPQIADVLARKRLCTGRVAAGGPSVPSAIVGTSFRATAVAP